MTRRLCHFLILFWLLAACSFRSGGETPAGTLAPAATVPATSTAAQAPPTASATLTAAPSVTPPPPPTDTPTVVPATPAGAAPQDLSIAQGDIFIYPPSML